ncbi:MAG: lysophospholipid acyltransferase family protein [Candidatus Babeliales bacterium]
MNIGTFLRTIFSRLLLLLLVLLFLIPIIIFICLPTRWRYNNKIVFFIMHWFYVGVLKCSLVPIQFIGKENIPKKAATIFVANHQSSLDIPLVGALADGASHIWLAKQELMQSPVLRFVLPLFTVLVDVTSPKKAVRSLREIFVLLDKNNIQDVIIFPEGARYTDGKMHDFFGGFVILAKKTGRPVVPICIVGVNKVYPPDSFWVYWHPITVIVGKPFIYQEGESDEIFKQRVYQWFTERMEFQQ